MASHQQPSVKTQALDSASKALSVGTRSLTAAEAEARGLNDAVVSVQMSDIQTSHHQSMQQLFHPSNDEEEKESPVVIASSQRLDGHLFDTRWPDRPKTGFWVHPRIIQVAKPDTSGAEIKESQITTVRNTAGLMSAYILSLVVVYILIPSTRRTPDLLKSETLSSEGPSSSSWWLLTLLQSNRVLYFVEIMCLLVAFGVALTNYSSKQDFEEAEAATAYGKQIKLAWACYSVVKLAVLIVVCAMGVLISVAMAGAGMVAVEDLKQVGKVAILFRIITFLDNILQLCLAPFHPCRGDSDLRDVIRALNSSRVLYSQLAWPDSGQGDYCALCNSELLDLGGIVVPLQCKLGASLNQNENDLYAKDNSIINLQSKDRSMTTQEPAQSLGLSDGRQIRVQTTKVSKSELGLEETPINCGGTREMDLTRGRSESLIAGMHVFHLRCIKQWAVNKSLECPTCSEPLPKMKKKCI